MMRRNPSSLMRSDSSRQMLFTKRFACIAKLSLMTFTSVLVLHFQINRPKLTHVYSTRDPFDNVRGGYQQTCGCTLPPSLQTPQNLASVSNSTINRCFESSALEDVNILMYSNFTGVDKLERVLKNAYSSKNSSAKLVQGHHVSNEGHSVAWSSQSVYDRFRQNLPQLYLGGYRQAELKIRYQNLLDGETYPDFPTSYIGMSFVFTCSDCRSCPLSKVNEIFRNISGDLNLKQIWGDCEYWGRENYCRTVNNFYQAKCQMYPSAAIPLMFAIQRFLGDFQNMPGITITEITPPWNTIDTGHASFDANVLYMNLSRVESGPVELKFFEVEKGSTAWLQLLDLFPTLGTECSELDQVRACTGTSLCNVFKGGVEASGYDLKCLDMRNKTQCQTYMNDTFGYVYLEDHNNLWGYINEHDRPWPVQVYHPTVKDWLRLMCMDYICSSYPRYLVLWETALAMKTSSFNQFLETKILSDFWAQNSGVCTKTYKNVLRYEPSVRTNEPTMFLETQCSQNFSTNAQIGGYCWLTGRYRNLTDNPDDDWHPPPDSWSSSSSTLFWCYNVRDQEFVYWFIITVGILFGWLGTIDLLFKWVASPLTKLIFEALSKNPSSN